MKRSPDHYLDLLPQTLHLIRGNRLVFCSNSADILEYVADLSGRHDLDLEAHMRPIEDLPSWDIAARIVDACEQMALSRISGPSPALTEKGVVHYWRDLRQGGAEGFRQILAIWLSKIALVEEQARGCVENDILAWIDASLYRFRYKRENWDWTRTETIPGKVSHYGNRMSFYGGPLPLNASFLCAHARVWSWLRKDFDAAAAEAAQTSYGHDEETILADCVRRRPEAFVCIGRPFPEKRVPPNRWLLNSLRRLR